MRRKFADQVQQVTAVVALKTCLDQVMEDQSSYIRTIPVSSS